MSVAPARLDARIRSFGKATALLNAMRKNPVVTFILTTRCNLACGHCFAPKYEKPVDLELDLAKETAEELRGLPRLYFSGGEPFRYMADHHDHERIFMDLVHFVAERVDKLCIDTNGMFIPAESASAKSYLGQFPKNTIFVLSLGPYHAEAIARGGRSLKQISDVLAEACSANCLGMEANSRLPRSVIASSGETAARERVIRELGPSIRPRDFRVYLNALYAQGEAQQLPASDTKPVSLNDFVEHTGIISEIGLFVSPRGQVIGGDHAAFLSAPPAFAVMGDLHTHTLAGILWEAIPGHARSGEPSAYFTTGSGTINRDTVPPFSPEDLKLISNRYGADRSQRHPDINQVFALVSDKSVPVDWEVNLGRADTDAILLSFGREMIEETIRQAARKFTDELLQLKPEKHTRVNFVYTIRKGVPFFEVELQKGGVKPVPNDFRLFLAALFNREGYLAREMYGNSTEWKKQLFIESMYERARGRLSQTGDYAGCCYAQILLEEIEERCQGAHAEEIIALIKSGSLAFDWTIKLFDRDGGRLRLGTLNRKLLESYQETQVMEMQAGPDFIKYLLQVDNDDPSQKKNIYLEARIKGSRIIFGVSTSVKEAGR